jgi:hypothetical protein
MKMLGLLAARRSAQRCRVSTLAPFYKDVGNRGAKELTPSIEWPKIRWKLQQYLKCLEVVVSSDDLN